MQREQALEQLKSHNPEPFLVQHALYTEAIMRVLAPRFQADPELWGLTGLLHDIDYPLTKDAPERHGLEAAKLVGDLPEEGVRAIAAHNSECTGVQPANDFAFALRCAESVTGLVSAAALVRPDGMQGMQASSLKKKMKDKAFAASVNRDRIRECEKIGLGLDEFLTLSISAIESC